jgi:hypothetical protein
MTAKKLLHHNLNWWQTVLSIIGTLACVGGFCWANLAEPRIDTQIHVHTDPLQDAIMYQNCLIMQRYTQDEIANADKMYTSLKRSEPKDKGETK